MGALILAPLEGIRERFRASAGSPTATEGPFHARADAAAAQQAAEQAELERKASRAEEKASERLSDVEARVESATGLRVITVPGTFSFDAAAAECAVRDAKLCTHTQMVQAYVSGTTVCRCGWTQTPGASAGTILVESVGQRDAAVRCGGAVPDPEDGITLCAEARKGILSLSADGGFAAHCCAVAE